MPIRIPVGAVFSFDVTRWLSIPLVAACALWAAAACSDNNPKKKPVGTDGGAYEGGTEGGGGLGGTGGSAGLDAGPDVVDAQAEAQPEAAPPPPPLFFSVSPGALGQPGSAVEQQTTPQSALYGSATASPTTAAGSNMLVVTPTDLGLDAMDDIDAVSVKKPMPANPFYYFSVDDANHFYVGNDVGLEASRYTQRGDVFVSDGVLHSDGEGTWGYNSFYSSGVSVGLGPHSTGGAGAEAGTTDAGADAGGGGGGGGDAGVGFLDDNLDAVEIGVTVANAATAYFSVDPGASGASGSSVATTPANERGCTIYASDRDGKNRVIYGCAQIGLAPGDNVDALAVVDTGTTTRVYFSIDKTSVGVSGTDVYVDAQDTYSAYQSEVFSSDGDGANHLVVDARGLDLDSENELDALAIVDDPRPPLYVPSGTCTLAPSPVAPTDGGVVYSGYAAAHISGSIELIYATSAIGGGNLVSAYDLSTCQLVGQSVAASGSFTGQLVVVPGAGWSAAQPLSNIDLWELDGNGIDFTLIHHDLVSGQVLESYTAPINGYMYGPSELYLPASKQFAFVGDGAIAVMDIPTGGTPDSGVVTLPAVTAADRFCYGYPNILGSDPVSGNIELTMFADLYFSPPDSRVCHLRADGYQTEPFQNLDQGSVPVNVNRGFSIPGKALYTVDRQNNDIVVNSFAPPSTLDGGVSDAGTD